MLFIILCMYLTDGTNPIIEKEEKMESYTIFMNYDSTIMNFRGKNDIQFMSLDEEPACQMRMSNLETRSFKKTILNHEVNYDPDFLNNIKLKSFIHMSHTATGMVALTGELIFYFLKFNMDQIKKPQNFKEENFIQKIKEIDLSKLSMREPPQLLYIEKNNMELILFPKQALRINLTLIDQDRKDIQVTNVPSFIQRPQRGITKSVDDYIFSLVGSSGFDIYIIKEGEIFFLKNLEYASNIKLYVVDFVIFKQSENQYRVYLADIFQGLMVMDVNLEAISFNIIMQIRQEGELLTLDTKNGVNIFIASKQGNAYFLDQYIINLQTQQWHSEKRLKIGSRILKIDASDELIIVSGANHHQIIFYNDWTKKPFFSTQFGLRDYKFYFDDDSNSISLGVTNSDVFLTKFRIERTRIICSPKKESQLNKVQRYRVILSESLDIDGKQQIVRTSRVVEVYISQKTIFSQWVLMVLALIFLILIIVCKYRLYLAFSIHRQFKKHYFEIQTLETQISVISAQIPKLSSQQQTISSDRPMMRSG